MLRGAAALVGVGTTAQGELPGRSRQRHRGRGARARPRRRRAREARDRRAHHVQGLRHQRGHRHADRRARRARPRATRRRSSTAPATSRCTSRRWRSRPAWRRRSRSSTARTSARPGSASPSVADGAERELLAPYGFLNIAGPAALALRRRQHLHGLTEEQLGHVAVVQRRHAQLNPLAVFRDPLTIDDYLAVALPRAPAAPARHLHDLRRRRVPDRHRRPSARATCRSRPCTCSPATRRRTCATCRPRTRSCGAWARPLADRIYDAAGHDAATTSTC